MNVVFNELKSWGPNRDLTLKLLSLKTAMLILLVSQQRGQTILNLSLDGMTEETGEASLVFRLKVLLKHNRQGDPLDTLILRSFDQCKRLCVLRAVKHYIARTKAVRKHSQLLLSWETKLTKIACCWKRINKDAVKITFGVV